MSKVKFQNYSGVKNAKDNPRCIAKEDLKNGMAVVYTVGADGKEYVATPTSVAEAKTVKHFVWNTIDKPELDNESDYTIKSGEYVRIFEFEKGEVFDVTADLVTTTTITAGTSVLVPDIKGGKYVVSTATDYTTNLLVKSATSFGGSGYDVVSK